MGWVVVFVTIGVNGFFLYDSAKNGVGITGLSDSDSDSLLNGWPGWLILFIFLWFLGSLWYIVHRLNLHSSGELSLATLPGVGVIADGSWELPHRHARKSLYPEPKPLISGGLYVGIWIVWIILLVIVADVTAALYGAAAGTVSAILLGFALSLIIGGINKAYARRK